MWVAGNHFPQLEELVKQHEGYLGTPEDEYKPKQDPTGSFRDSGGFHWYETRSGIDGEITTILDALSTKGIPWRAVDDGCWGAWPEEEVVFDGRHRGSRVCLDGQPVFTAGMFAQIMKDNTREEVLDLIEGFFSDDVTRWVL